MRKLFVFVLTTVCLSFTCAPRAHEQAQRSSSQSASSVAAAPRREVAVTFDDLPAVHAVYVTGAPVREMTERLLRQVKANGVPATGLVTAGKIFPGGRLDPALVSALELWVKAGYPLGNHTYSHPDVNTMKLEDYEADVVRGEEFLRRFLEERGQKLTYFRHPQLHTGLNVETKRALDGFLAARGYRIAPVTIDNNDFIFASAYAAAKQRGDRAAMQRLVAAYIPYMETMFDFFEKLSVEVVGYEIKQVLLLHANEINADHFDQLAAMMKRRGYRFISLDEALADKAYQLPDEYAGRAGFSWLHRWALTKGMAQRDEPREPAWVREMSNQSRPTAPNVNRRHHGTPTR